MFVHGELLCSIKGALAAFKDPGPLVEAITRGDLETAEELLGGITESESESEGESDSESRTQSESESGTESERGTDPESEVESGEHGLVFAK